MSKNMDRKDFLKLGAAGALALAGAAAYGPSAAGAEALAFDATVAWDGEYDVVVVGAGMAGMTAAINAAAEGAAVLLLDKASAEEAGGNSRVCHQLYGTVNDVEEGFKYYSAMRGGFMSTSDEVLMAYVEGMSKLDEYLIGLGVDPAGITSWAGCGIPTYETEHPELPGGQAFEGHSIVPQLVNGALFNFNRDYIAARPDEIDLWYESPARELIQDPLTKTVLGVCVEYGGERLNIRARNGLVLTCGGFENNRAMVESYLGIGGEHGFYGSKHNTGDGITMAMAAGANLWHMHNYESTGVGGNVLSATSPYFMMLNDLASAPMILVGPDGTRYAREAIYPAAMRHGHIYVAGDWTFPAYVEGSFSVVDESTVRAFDAAELMESGIAEGIVFKGDTLEELGGLTGMAYIADTVRIYNRYCEAGLDEAFRRPAETLLPFGEGPFYAIRMNIRGILNTQGGPERNENAQVIDVFGNPIPHLYSAGELGGVTAHRYQGGGNIAECLVFGQIAGKNAAKAKDPLPPYSLEAVESELKYVKGVRNDLA